MTHCNAAGATRHGRPSPGPPRGKNRPAVKAIAGLFLAIKGMELFLMIGGQPIISGMKKAPGISARCFLLDFIQLLDALVRIESHDRLDTVYHASLFR